MYKGGGSRGRVINRSTIPGSFLGLLLLLPVLLGAQEFNRVGTSGFVFLEIPVSARSAALAETGMTLSDMRSEGLFVNPALIPLSGQKISLNATYAEWYVETSHQAVGVTYRFPMIGTFGISMLYYDFGEMRKTRNPRVDETGSFVDLGTFSAGAYAAGLSYGRQLTEQFSVGATVKYVRETIDVYYADNVILDVGFIYDTGFESLRIGTFLQNFGLEAAYVAEKFRMPQMLRLGLSGEVLGSISAPERLTVIAEAVHASDADGRIHIAAEGMLLNALALRAGYKFGYDHEDLTLGLGLQFIYDMKLFRLDFSYMRHRELENTLRYTLVIEL